MTDAEREEQDQMQACLERIDDTLGRIGARVAEDWTVRRRPVPAFVFAEAWKRFRDRPTNERISETVKFVLDQIDLQYRIELRKDERAALRKPCRAWSAA